MNLCQMPNLIPSGVSLVSLMKYSKKKPDHTANVIQNCWLLEYKAKGGFTQGHPGGKIKSRKLAATEEVEH